jgi:hypothetical protein
MKYFRILLCVLLGVPLSISTVTQAQSWSSILPSSRAINWTTAGLPAVLPDGETTANPWTPPTRTQYGSTLSPSGSAATDLSNINTALSKCTNGTYVLLGSGTFLIQGAITLYGHSCTLRGSGPIQTTLEMSGAGMIWLGASGSGGTITLTSNPGAGATSITGTLSGTAPAVGEVVQLNQCDTGFTGTVSGGTLTCTGTSADNGGLFVCGFHADCMTDAGEAGSNNSQYQTLVVTSVNNTGGAYTVGLSAPIYMPNWSTRSGAVLRSFSTTYRASGVGVEDMTITNNASTSTEDEGINMYNAYASWVKGVRFIGSAQYEPLSVASSTNDLVMNNYFFVDPDTDSDYGPAIVLTTASDILILNNIMTSAVEPMEAFGGNSGNVFAYNYGRDAFTAFLEDSPMDHHAYSSFDLFEGNQMAAFDEDDTWGTHDLNTYFRNNLRCYDAPYGTLKAGANYGILMGNYQRFDNLIGNAVGTSGQCTTYQGSTTPNGSVFAISTADSLAESTLMRWGNVSVVDQSTDTPTNSGIRFVSSEVPSILPSLNALLSIDFVPSSSLPCSFFLKGYTSTSCTSHSSGGTGLSWWKVCTAWSSFPNSCSATQTQPFPSAGPDVTGGPYVNGHAYSIPAALAWQNLPVDPAYQKSYTITSSQWSGGTETLTISGLPSTTCAGSTAPCHLMGAFQTSSLNAACTSGATFNSNNEILMTGSSSTTVSYALASNPGVSCTGTFKFPEVREFDERVYEADSSTAGQLGSPTDLTGSLVANP